MYISWNARKAQFEFSFWFCLPSLPVCFMNKNKDILTSTVPRESRQNVELCAGCSQTFSFQIAHTWRIGTTLQMITVRSSSLQSPSFSVRRSEITFSAACAKITLRNLCRWNYSPATTVVNRSRLTSFAKVKALWLRPGLQSGLQQFLGNLCRDYCGVAGWRASGQPVITPCSWK